MTIKELTALLSGIKNRSKAKRKADMIDMILENNRQKIAQQDASVQWESNRLWERKLGNNNDYYRPYLYTSDSEIEEERKIASGRGVPIDEYACDDNMCAIIDTNYGKLEDEDDAHVVVGLDLNGMYESTYDPNFITTLENVYGYGKHDIVKGGWRIPDEHVKDVKRLLNRIRNGVAPFKTPSSLKSLAAMKTATTFKPSQASQILPKTMLEYTYHL